MDLLTPRKMIMDNQYSLNKQSLAWKVKYSLRLRTTTTKLILKILMSNLTLDLFSKIILPDWEWSLCNLLSELGLVYLKKLIRSKNNIQHANRRCLRNNKTGYHQWWLKSNWLKWHTNCISLSETLHAVRSRV